MKNEIKEILNDLRKYANEGGEHKLMEYEIKHIQCYITNLQRKYDKALEDSDKQTHKLMAIRKYLKSNEREYGSLEDNEKIILGIIESK